MYRLKPEKPLVRKRRVWVQYVDRTGSLRWRYYEEEVKPRHPTLKKRSPIPVKEVRADSSRPSKSSPGLRTQRSINTSKGKGNRVMKFRFADTNGPYVVTDTRPGQLGFTQSRTAHSDNLYGITSVKGDFKRPNPQAFTHEKTYYFYGTVGTLWETGHTTIGVGYPSLTFNTLFGVGVDGFSAAAYNQALEKVYDSFRGGVDLSIDLCEIHKTKGMMGKMLKSLTDLGTTLRKIRRANPRDVGGLWLEYVYGWKPLASTVYETIKRYNQPDKAWHKAVGRGGDSYSRTGQRLWGTIDSQNYYYDVKAQGTSRCRIQCEFVFAPSTLAKLSGYTSLNPVSIAWELLPYSFVIDWFVNVGGYLRSMETAMISSITGSFLRGYRTEGLFAAETQTLNIEYVRPGTNVTKDFWKANGSYRGTKKLRTVISSAPLPRIPPISPSLGPTRLISAASLLSQQVKSWEHRRR